MHSIDKYIYSSLDCLNDPLFIVSDKNKVVFTNKAFIKLLGSELNGKIEIDSDISEFWNFDLKEIKADQEITSEFKFSENNILYVRIDLKIIEGMYVFVRVLHALQTDIDVSFHSQRLETLGMLAGGIVHDFNNMLTGILGHVAYLKNILPKIGNHAESLVAIEQGARKSSLLSHQILNFSKLDTSNHPTPHDLCQIISNTCSLLRGAISPKYNLRYRIPDFPFYIKAVEGKIAQIIVNLVINARDAIDEKGFIEVGVEFAKDEERLKETLLQNLRPNKSSETEKNENSNLLNKNYVRLFVLDDGKGIPKDIITKIFDPFFTTKKENGTGLGLTTVKSIVNSLNGGIEIFSQEGTGTSISIYLPLYEQDSLQIYNDPELENLEPLEGNNERILIVDDENLVRNTINLSLKHLGYNVEMASSGNEAIYKFKENEFKFDLVLIDMVMPNISGEELFFTLKSLDPNINALIISGHTSESTVKNILKNGGRGFIQKPFTIYELSKKVKEYLS